MTVVRDAQERAAQQGTPSVTPVTAPHAGVEHVAGSPLVRVLGGALAYVVITFPLAVVWHLLLFEQEYRAFGYFGRQNPSFALGAAAIALQGLILSWAYPRVAGFGNPATEGLRFGMVAGLFLWSANVIAAAAKWELEPLTSFVVMQSAYFALNFAIFGVALGVIHGRRDG